MNEQKFYTISADEWNPEITDEEFIALAEQRGTVYSKEWFTWAFNYDELDTANDYLLII